jgi:hypothetical protein
MSSPPLLPFNLPPLPKSLSGAFDKENLVSLQEEMNKQQQHQPMKKRPKPPPRNPPPAPPRNPPPQPPRPAQKRIAPPVPPPPLQHQGSSSRLSVSSVRSTSSLDTQLAILRQEMVKKSVILHLKLASKYFRLYQCFTLCCLCSWIRLGCGSWISLFSRSYGP